MQLFPVLVALLCGLLALASPTPDSAGPDQAVHQSVIDGGSSVEVHSLSIAGFTSQVKEENITLHSPKLLKLQCYLPRNSTDIQISNVTWRHGYIEIKSEHFTYKLTDDGWHTALEILVNSTGSYDCIFIANKETKAAFHIRAPAVHGGGKTLVSYNGDRIDLKCDSHAYTPMEWLWYKVTENETVLLNFTSHPSKYEHHIKKANETKLCILHLTEGDSGDYVCKAVFKIGESEAWAHITVLSIMTPLKVFFAIVAEVVVLVIVILSYEWLSKKKKSKDDVKTENEQIAHLNSEENNTCEASAARQRKVL